MPLKAASTAKRTPQGSAAPPHTPSPPPSNPTMSDRSPARPTNGDAHATKDNQLPTAMSTSVNRKKQKRRQKQAARLAAENHHLHNGYASIDVANSAGPRDEQDLDDVEPHDSVNGDLYSDEDHDSLDAYHGVLSPSGLNHSHQAASGRSSRKKKGKKGRSDSQTIADGSSTPRSTPSISMSHAFPSSFPSHFGPRAILRSAKERNVWNTSTQEERENIKTFWLELGEEERRQLVKVEKDAVLKKMKEQQKHSCSCTVCGRKRTAIEEELEVLYDAYYEELEHYANNNQDTFEKTSPIVPPPRLYHPPLRSPGQHTRTHGQFHPSRGRVHELPEEEEEEEDLEEEYDEEEEEEEEDEPYSDEEEDDDLEDEDTRAARADFFAFGNSLTVKDGILTVADDLLKNDGKHFIDMMEQLAERRMQREEDTQYGIAAAHESLHSGHNHGPLDEEDYDDEEEDDEDYDSQEEEDYEEDEMDAMTEEQRMEEGRRMFQIFAARMFEQRVLTAYREKVAEQRQQKLIEELMEEETRNEQRSVKKAREAQKKKDKKRLQRQAKEEEKARRDSEKAAEEAAAKAAQEKKLEEQRQKREEQRKKREAERKAQEEERARKEAEKQRRLQEERDRQAEAERKHREKKEQEKQRREEAQRKEAEEQEAREKKAKEDRENKAREDELRKKSEQQDPKAHDAQTAKRVSQPNIPIPTNLPHPQGPSPYSQVATPMVPKAPTPVRPRQPSFQDSHASSPRSQTASAEQSQVSVSPRSMPPSQSSGASSATSKQGLGHHPMLQHPPPPTPLSPLSSAARSHPPGLFGANGFPSHPPGLSGMAPRPPMASDLPGYPPHTSSLMSPLRGFPATNGIHAPPGINGTQGARPMPPGRGFPLDPGHGLSSFHGQQPINNPFSPPQSGLSQARHSRQASGSFERSPLNTHAQPSPISRPSPIKRPSSTAPQDHQRDNGRTTTQQDVDELSTHLGSSALLDGTDALFNSNLSQSLPGATAPGSFRQPTRASFGAPSPFPDPLSLPKHPSFSVHPSGVGSNINITWDDPYKK